MSGAVKTVKKGFKSIFRGIKKVFAKVAGSKIFKVLSIVAAVFTAGAALAGAFPSFASTSVGKFLVAGNKAIAGASSALKTGVKEAGTAVSEGLKEAAGAIGNKVGDAVQQIGEAISGSGNLGAKTVDGFKAASDFAKEGITKAGDFAEQTFNKLKSLSGEQAPGPLDKAGKEGLEQTAGGTTEVADTAAEKALKEAPVDGDAVAAAGRREARRPGAEALKDEVVGAVKDQVKDEVTEKAPGTFLDTLKDFASNTIEGKNLLGKALQNETVQSSLFKGAGALFQARQEEERLKEQQDRLDANFGGISGQGLSGIVSRNIAPGVGIQRPSVNPRNIAPVRGAPLQRLRTQS